MVARGNPAPDAFGETGEDDALHPDRQQAELPAPQPRDGAHWAFPPLDPAAAATKHRVARVMAVDIVARLEPVDIADPQRRSQIIGAFAVEQRPTPVVEADGNRPAPQRNAPRAPPDQTNDV